MKTALFIISIIFIKTNLIVASCEPDILKIFPYGTNVSSSTIFFIEFAEQDYKLKNIITEISLFIIKENGKEIEADVSRIDFNGTFGSFLITPCKKLPFGDSISLRVEYKNNNNNKGFNKFKKNVENIKWKVICAVDKTSPYWISDSLSYKISIGNKNSSESGTCIYVNCPISDNFLHELTKNIPPFKFYPILYEITYKEKKVICSARTNNIMIYWGSCGSNFEYLFEDIITFSVRPIDSSGNYGISKDIKIINTWKN